MQYIITFLEGVISFISPCMLPLLPVYISYFAGNSGQKRSTVVRALAFVVGFTAVFCLFGVFAGTFSFALRQYQTLVNIVCGGIVIVFGLSCLNIVNIPFFHRSHKKTYINGILSAFVFGIVFSVSHTPCVSAFLGSAIMMASVSGTALKGVSLLFTYSLGMGIPFLLSAILIDRLTTVFNAIKKHYAVVNIICGTFLILVGIGMMTGFIPEMLSHVGHSH